ETGAGIRNANVVAIKSGSGGTETFMSLYGSMQSMGSSDGSGNFSISNVEEGTYDLRVFSNGYTDALIERVKVRGKRPADVGEISLDRGLSFSIKVVSKESKSPVAQAMAMVRDDSGRLFGLQSPAMSGADGVLTIQALDPGEYRVTVSHSTFASSSLTIQVEEGAQIPTVELEPGTQIAVQVEDGKGRGIERATVQLLDDRGRDVLSDRIDFRIGYTGGGQVTDAQGKVRLSNIRPASYRVVAVDSEGNRSDEVEVDANADGGADVTLTID
ncbi:MAG: carboxypeptidase regulatory-like domain-containing protein, partial [Planctomycetota bacterium]